jgi:hypothetical protein
VQALGEIRTALLRHSSVLSEDEARQVLLPYPGGHVYTKRRPISYAVSTDMLVGLDCSLATASKTRASGIGTVCTHAGLTGGRIAQTSSYATVVIRPGKQRVTWDRYLSRPGELTEYVGKTSWADIRDGFLGGRPAEALNMGAIAERALDEVQLHEELDLQPPFQASRAALRWAAEEIGADEKPSAEFVIVSASLRTLRLHVPEVDLRDVLELCEDLARHDWLLSTLTDLVDRASSRKAQPSALIAGLGPVIEHLPHLWRPRARIVDELAPMWESFDHRTRFSQQWEALVSQIRDRLAVASAKLAIRPQPSQRPAYPTPSVVLGDRSP